MRFALRIARKLTISCLALVGALTVLGWFFEWLDWPIRHEVLPSIADSMVLHSDEDGAEWQRRLRGRFEHTQLSGMVAALRAEGFSIDPEQRLATRDYVAIPCRYTFSIQWDAATDDTLQGLRGNVRHVCL